MACRPIVAHAGVPAEIDYGRHRSIGALFEESVQKYHDRPAYTNMGRSISFGDLDRLNEERGRGLEPKRERLGDEYHPEGIDGLIGGGDVVGICGLGEVGEEDVVPN